nr:Magnesium transporter MgtE [Candidatus Pantoea persica]
MSASHSQRLSEIRHRILTLLLSEPDMVEALLEKPSERTPEQQRENAAHQAAPTADIDQNCTRRT